MKPAKSDGIPLDEIRVARLKDPKRADFALKLALKDYERDGDAVCLLDTLRLVARTQGGITELSRKPAVSHQALNEALSQDGNPRLRTFQSVLEAPGLRMRFKLTRTAT